MTPIPAFLNNPDFTSARSELTDPALRPDWSSYSVMADSEGFENLAHDPKLRLLAECIADQQAAGFRFVLDLRQAPCPGCGAPGFNTGWGYFRHTCGSEVTNGEDADCDGCTGRAPALAEPQSTERQA